VLLILADRQGWLLTVQPDELARYDGQSFVVVRVIDGDTFEIEAQDPVEQRPMTRVRLWGVNCPEASRPGQPIQEPWAAQATEFTRRLTQAGPVTLRLEPQRVRGVYGRVLAHVTAAEGTNLNEALLLEGLAVADDRWPHDELVRYAAAEMRAKQAGCGLWSPAQPVADE
jgi:endonuclease YncB( thermonuclease family)